jgi:hypothetical protein
MIKNSYGCRLQVIKLKGQGKRFKESFESCELCVKKTVSGYGLRVTGQLTDERYLRLSKGIDNVKVLDFFEISYIRRYKLEIVPQGCRGYYSVCQLDSL